MRKNDEFCISSEELCIKNEELRIKNDEFCRRQFIYNNWRDTHYDFSEKFEIPGFVSHVLVRTQAILTTGLDLQGWARERLLMIMELDRFLRECCGTRQ